MLVVKNLPANAGDLKDVDSIPESEMSPRGGHCNSPQYSSLENLTNREPGRQWPIGLQRDMTEAT